MKSGRSGRSATNPGKRSARTANSRKEARHYRALARAGTDRAAESHENRVVASVAAERVQPNWPGP
jgi:hypothetical protein